jgi:FKBP-type peptidyl-prolyl cis-trans isomerase FkpA
MDMRYLVPLIVLAFILTACKKDETSEQANQDDAAINEYLVENGLTATPHSSGLYYDITKEGTGGHPNLSHTVVVDYKGSLLNGTVFDESTNAVEFQLNGLITGFQIAVSLLKPGGEGIFYIPSQLGYGDQQVGDIPPNSILIFEIELVEYF